jgi:hypothetical protein
MQLQVVEALGRLVAAAHEVQVQLLGVLRERAVWLTPTEVRRRYVVVVASDQVAHSRDPREPEDLGNLPSHRIADVETLFCTALETFDRSAVVRLPRRLSGRLRVAEVARWIRGQLPGVYHQATRLWPLVKSASAIWEVTYPGWGLGRAKELPRRRGRSDLVFSCVDRCALVHTMEMFLADAPLELDLRRVPANVSQLRVILAPRGDEVRELRVIRPNQFVPRNDRACGDSFLDIFIESSSTHSIDVMLANRVGVGSVQIAGIQPYSSARLHAGLDWVGKAY